MKTKKMKRLEDRAMYATEGEWLLTVAAYKLPRPSRLRRLILDVIDETQGYHWALWQKAKREFSRKGGSK
jgi:hypothetical protein